MKYRSTLSIFGFLTLMTLNSFCQSPDDRGYIVQVGDYLDDMEFQLTNGTTTSLSDLRGQVVVLQYTASWCVVCRKEMPHLEKEVWLPNKDKGLMLIGIDYKEPMTKVQKFAQQMAVTYPLALDLDGQHFYQVAANGAGVTRNVILDQTGKIIFLTRLFDQEEFEEMKKVIAAALE